MTFRRIVSSARALSKTRPMRETPAPSLENQQRKRERQVRRSLLAPRALTHLVDFTL